MANELNKISSIYKWIEENLSIPNINEEDIAFVVYH